jgi:hypothetical protein
MLTWVGKHFFESAFHVLVIYCHNRRLIRRIIIDSKGRSLLPVFKLAFCGKHDNHNMFSFLRQPSPKKSTFIALFGVLAGHDNQISRKVTGQFIEFLFHLDQTA